MKGTSKVIMGATLVMVVSLAIVLGLILVLLAELYCSLLLRRRKLRNTTSTSTAATLVSASNTTSSPPSSSLDQPSSSPPPPTSIHAPRSFVFPSNSFKDDKAEGKDHGHRQHAKLHQVLEIQEINTVPRHICLSSNLSPANSCAASPKQLEVHVQSIDKADVGGEHLVYISNPIYENGGRLSQVGTPFETPDTSPSRLENSSDSSGEEEKIQLSAKRPELLPATPHLTPMKKLPAEACSVSLRDAKSIGTSASWSNSNNCVSSSSSGSPCTSPSW